MLFRNDRNMDEWGCIIRFPNCRFSCSIPRFKQRFSFVIPDYGNLYGLLDIAKVADIVIFLVSPESGVDRYGEHCLSCLFTQGMPSSLIAVQVCVDVSRFQ